MSEQTTDNPAPLEVAVVELQADAPSPETALRRPGFTEGRRVVLGDRHEWAFPKAVPCIYPSIREDGSVAMLWSLSFGPAHRELLEDLEAATEPAECLTLVLRMAVLLLLQNYSLDNRALRRLLPVDLGGVPDNEIMWATIREVVLS